MRITHHRCLCTNVTGVFSVSDFFGELIYTVSVVYRMRISCHTRMVSYRTRTVSTIRVWYVYSAPYAYIGSYAYGTSHTCMGYPVCIWANIMSHTHMGVPYEYACIIIHSYTTCTPGVNFCLLTKY